MTSRVAAMLMNMFFPGANVQMQQGGIGRGKAGGGGLFGGLGGILGIGAVPVFAGGAPGGTPPFLPSPSGAGAGMGAAPAAGGSLSKAGLAGMLPGLKSFFGFGDNNWVDMGGGHMGTGGWISQYGSFGDKLQALGKSHAALMGGAPLAMDGLRRGGNNPRLVHIGSEENGTRTGANSRASN